MKGPRSGSERRKHFRKETLFGVDIIRIGETNLLYKYDHEMGRNISLGGVCVEATEVLAPPTIIRMKLMLTSSSPLIKLEGAVVWAKEYRRPEAVVEGIRIAPRTNFLMGIEFYNTSESDRKKIEFFVNKADK